MEFIFLLIKIGVVISCILIGSGMGERRGRRQLGALLGFLLGPIGLLILLAFPVVKDKANERSEVIDRPTRMRTRCSECLATLKAPSNAKGKRFRCGACGAKAIVQVFES